MAHRQPDQARSGRFVITTFLTALGVALALGVAILILGRPPAVPPECDPQAAGWTTQPFNEPSTDKASPIGRFEAEFPFECDRLLFLADGPQPAGVRAYYVQDDQVLVVIIKATYATYRQAGGEQLQKGQEIPRIPTGLRPSTFERVVFERATAGDMEVHVMMKPHLGRRPFRVVHGRQPGGNALVSINIRDTR